MYYSEEIVEEVRMRNDIVDVISGYVELKKKGSSHFGLCPFHNEKSPSFSVSRSKQMYYCFGCGAGGTVFNFLMDYENMSFPEVVEFLAQRAGIALPVGETSKRAKERSDHRTLLLEMNKKAAQYFYGLLKSKDGAKAYAYLTNRGLSEEIIRQFGLGYSDKYSDHLYQYLKEQGYGLSDMREIGLVRFDEKKGAHDMFWNRVMFPIMDANSRVIGFGGRVMGEAQPKYLNSPESSIFDKSRNLYGLHRAKTSKQSYFLLCEGYMDVIALHKAGFTNAVASLGTAFTAGHANLLKRYVKEVYLAYDSDSAGIRAALRAVPILREAGLLAKVIDMTPHKDPDEFLKALGREAFENRIKEAKNGFLFGLDILQREYNLQDPGEKTAFFVEAATRLTQFEMLQERDNYIEAVAKRYGSSKEALSKLVEKAAAGRVGAKPHMEIREATVQKPQKESGLIVSQKQLLAWIAEDEALLAQIRRYLTWEDFTEGLCREIAKRLYSGESPAKITDSLSAEGYNQEKIAAVFHAEIAGISPEEPEKMEQAICEVVLKVKIHSINEKLGDANLPLAELNRLVAEKREWQNGKQLHISLQ